jgi:hypothetical protein
MSLAVRQASRARVAPGAGALLTAVARVLHAIVALVVLLIVVAIVLRLAAANGHNTIVRDIHDAARALVGPFQNTFLIRNPRDSITVNWGLAAVVYLLAGWSIAALVDRAAGHCRRLAKGSV